jgi:hypothetical protein
MIYPSYQGQRASENPSSSYQGQRASEESSYQEQRASENPFFSYERLKSRQAVRSFLIHLRNGTMHVFRRTNISLPHGIFSGNGNAVPPEQIPPRIVGTWESESDGFATGTEGTVTYATPVGDVFIHWNNPYIGSNGLGIAVPAGWSYVNSDISGDNVWCTITITDF